MPSSRDSWGAALPLKALYHRAVVIFTGMRSLSTGRANAEFRRCDRKRISMAKGSASNVVVESVCP